MRNPVQCVLVGHHLTLDNESRYPDEDGGAFICTDFGTARDFKTVEAAQKHIETFRLNQDAPIWSIFLLTEIPISEQRV